MAWTIQGLIPGNLKRFSSSPKHPDLAWGSIQPPIQWVLGVKSLGRDVDHSHPANEEVKNEWRCTSARIRTFYFYHLHFISLTDL
jgi:hypothetical protein